MKRVEIVEFKFLEDERGWVAWPVRDALLKNGQLSNLHVPCLKPGAIRGNHYHADTFEFAIVLSGPCKALFLDNNTGEKWTVLVTKENPKLFKISPDTSHAFKNEGQEDIFLICYYKPFRESQNQDVHRYVILS